MLNIQKGICIFYGPWNSLYRRAGMINIFIPFCVSTFKIFVTGMLVSFAYN